MLYVAECETFGNFRYSLPLLDSFLKVLRTKTANVICSVDNIIIKSLQEIKEPFFWCRVVEDLTFLTLLRSALL